MNTPTYDHLQVIEAIHGATFSEEFDRVQAKLADAAIPAEIIRLYEVEILFAERLISAWKKQFLKGQRPIQYTAKKELVKVLKDEITYWQGGADWANAESNGSAAEVAPAVIERPHRATKRQVASLQPPLTMEAVKAMLGELQITKEGETAAALSALVASGKLTGDASKVHRWCEAAAISPLPCRKTVYNKLEYREGGQFSNPNERRIFNEVLRQAKAIR
jgi:hypothetical protein